MSPTVQGNQGQTTKTTGQNIVAGVGEYTDLLISELNARYYEWNYRGNIFFAANQALGLTLAGLSSGSSTPFVLYNPIGSGKNLVLLEILTSATSGAGATANLLVWLAGCLSTAQAAPASSGPLIIHSSLLGGGVASVASAFTQGALPSTPVVLRNLGVLSNYSSTTGIGAATANWKDEVAGAVIVPPGIVICTQTSAAMSVSTVMSWCELPI